MLKYLQSILEILLGTAIIFFGAMLAVWGDSVFFGLITVLVGLLVYLIAVKNSPRNNDKPSKLKMKGSKRIALVLSCLIVAFIFFAAGISNTDNSDTEDFSTTKLKTDTETTTTIPEETKVVPDRLGEYTIAIKEYYTSEGFYDEELLVVVYSFTNNSNDTISFSDAIEDKLFQNGVELDLYIATNIPGQVEIKDSWKELKPGASFDVPRAYILNFETPSSVDVELNTENGTEKTLKYTIEIE